MCHISHAVCCDSRPSGAPKRAETCRNRSTFTTVGSSRGRGGGPCPGPSWQLADDDELRGAAQGQLLLDPGPEAIEVGGAEASAATTHATTRWPHSGSGRPATATSATDGSWRRTASTAAGPDVLAPGDDHVREPAVRRPAGRSAPMRPASPVANHPLGVAGAPTRPGKPAATSVPAAGSPRPARWPPRRRPGPRRRRPRRCPSPSSRRS